MTMLAKRMSRLGLTLVAVLGPMAWAAQAPDPIAAARQSCEEGYALFSQGDFVGAEASLTSALEIADSRRHEDRTGQLRAVRTRCLRLLTRIYYPHMKRTRSQDALRTGHAYQNLLLASATAQEEVGIECLCENALHLAKVHAYVGEDGKAEEILRTKGIGGWTLSRGAEPGPPFPQ